MLGRDYGPNDAQVKAFIDRLKSLSGEDWVRAAAMQGPTKAAYGSLDLDHVETAYRSRYRSISALNNALRDARRAIDVNWDIQLMAEVAVIGLVACDVLTVAQFTAAYAPFSGVIPVQTLGAGKAPAVRLPPETREERFLLRLKSLSAGEWDQIAKLAYAIQDAVGVEAIESAVGDALEAVHERVRLGELDSGHLGSLLLQVDADLVPTGFQEGSEFTARLGEKLKSSDWASALTAWWQTKFDAVRLAAKRAIGALVAGNRIAPKDFALLYIPFAALIPKESLETPGSG